MNAHDIESFVSLFAEDYDSEQPAHPDRRFRGRDQVRENWSAVFSGIPDFRAELVASAVEADTAWTEWRWHGTHEDGSRLDMAGVIVMGVRDATITCTGSINANRQASAPEVWSSGLGRVMAIYLGRQGLHSTCGAVPLKGIHVGFTALAACWAHGTRSRCVDRGRATCDVAVRSRRSRG